MNSIRLKIGLLFLGGTLAAGAAPIAFAGDQCMDIRGRALFTAPPEADCTFEGERFDFCLEGTVRGKLKGTWRAFGQNDWFVDLPASEFPVPEETLSNYNREFNVFSTRDGLLVGDSQYVFDIRIFDNGGGFTTPIMIERGTGRFEGATGWIVGVFTDAALSRGVLLGKVCGPYILGDDADEAND